MQNELPLISVIVPIYGVEKYLEKCVQSIRKQTYTNLEILLVDDGSKDNCPALCDRYAEEDARIVVLHKQNGGLSSARNYALDRCKGEYITCIDADDYVALDMIEKLYAAMRNNKADMVCCRWKNLYEDGRITEAAKRKEPMRVVPREEAFEIMLYQIDTDVCAWGKLYKKELFAGVRYPEGKLYEDFAVIFSLLEQTETVVFLEYDGYYYLQRESGIMRENFRKEKMVLIDFAEEMYTRIEQKHPNLQAAAACRAVRAHFTIYLQIPGGKQFRRERKRIEENVKKWRNIVWKDKKADRGTKMALLLSCFSFRMLYRMKNIKNLAKRKGQI